MTTHTTADDPAVPANLAAWEVFVGQRMAACS